MSHEVEKEGCVNTFTSCHSFLKPIEVFYFKYLALNSKNVTFLLFLFLLPSDLSFASQFYGTFSDGAVSMGSIEPINFQRRVLELLNF